jgi:O-methyltransferase involved in polyketide biosynthesis
MSEKIPQTLDGVSETLLMALYVRVRASQRPDALIRDAKSVAIANQIACDFARLRMQRHDEIAVIMRMKKFDSHVGGFKPRPFLFIAEGVFPYFEEAQVKGLFLTLRAHFPGAELVRDAHSPFIIWADNLHLALAKVKARLRWGLKAVPLHAG